MYTETMIQPPFDIEALWALSPADFDNKAHLLAKWQAEHNPVYKDWVKLSGGISFLPISFFKTHDVFIGPKPVVHFESSGTTGDVVSKHWVGDLGIYESSFNKGFELFYGQASEYCIIGLLPSYLERSHSSLVYMVDHLIKQSAHTMSGFYLNEFEKLDAVLKTLESAKQKTILIGVSFALMDFADAFPQQLRSTIVMETGGMKGRRTEMIKPMLHAYLNERLGTSTIHSEYGMTELLSQAYAIKDGIFKCPPWMKILVGDEEDPNQLKTVGRGILHVIDLANIYSCAFIATQDIAEVYEDGSFSVLGRSDNSDRRGCSLLVV
ncbi:MAG: acyl transferase [Sediminibacterium sp.]